MQISVNSPFECREVRTGMQRVVPPEIRIGFLIISSLLRLLYCYGTKVFDISCQDRPEKIFEEPQAFTLVNISNDSEPCWVCDEKHFFEPTLKSRELDPRRVAEPFPPGRGREVARRAPTWCDQVQNRGTHGTEVGNFPLPGRRCQRGPPPAPVLAGWRRRRGIRGRCRIEGPLCR